LQFHLEQQLEKHVEAKIQPSILDRDFAVFLSRSRGGIRMTYKYVPGMLSHLYQNLPASERSDVDQQVDALFQKETGITAKLDWNDRKDRPQARVWLTMRDVVIGKRFLAKIQNVKSDFNLQHEYRIRALAQDFQKKLSGSLERRGLPAVHGEPLTGKLIEGSHLAIEAFDMVELTDLWPLVLGEHLAHGATLYLSGVVGPFVNLIGGLYAIGHANEAGQRGAERNAFKWGFAESVASMAEGTDWAPTLSVNTPWGRQQARGRNAAIRMVREMGQDVGKEFLQRYKGPNGKATILLDLGGYD
jgi:hypothetical protein